jgi:hypothetical protein
MNASLLLATIGGISGDGTEWSLSFEGISFGWALLGFLLLTGGTIFAYLKLTPIEPIWRRIALIALRVAVFAVFLILVIKPVLNLTLNEPVRQSLPVAIDISQSMAVKDRRDRPDDLVRAAIADGVLPADGGLKQTAPADAAQTLGNISRWELLKKLAVNKKLNLWPSLGEQADLAFYKFGRQAAPAAASSENFTMVDAEHLFASIKPDQTATGVGDAIRQILQGDRSRPLGGLFLITDGQNNVGSSPLEAAQLAREQGVPLFIYGIGVTSPPDVILEEIEVQRLAFVEERVEVRARIRTQALEGKSASVVLRVNGVDAEEKTVEIGGDGEQFVDLHFVPTEAGEAKIEVEIEPLAEEATKDNNSASARVRVTDQKFHVLLIEQEPRWDFRYLLAYLQRDRRLDVRCVVIDGEPGLDLGGDSVFLPALPNDREEFFKSEVLILGDVNPDDLGVERMEIIRDWVEAGGGIIFLAGPKFNPLAYADTPLESVLPIVPDTSISRPVAARRLREPFKLELTTLGETSPYLQMAADPEENRAIWDKFPGVRWTARTLRARPGAEVLLVDPRPDVANRYGAPPVFAMQGYGTGTSVFLGIDETNRWRSGVGEKYYSILWGQIMQSLALELLEGGSARTQLKADRREYVAGDRVVITGRAYNEGFSPYIAPNLEGTLKVTTTGPNGEPVESEKPLNLSASSEGGFRAEFEAEAPGDYAFSTNRDPETVLQFSVVEPRLERIQTALNERLLRAMAESTGGRFLREENLHELSKLIREKSATVSSFKKKELYHSNWWLVCLIALVAAEWFIRRISQLK